MRARICCPGAILCGLMAMVLAAGCGPSYVEPTPDQAEEAKLREVGQMLREYQLLSKKPPKSLKALESASGSSPGGFELIKGGEVVVLWGATLPDTGEEPGVGPSDEVLAYVKRVPQEGGPVLMLNRTIRRMTAEEFRAAPKAGAPPREK